MHRLTALSVRHPWLTLCVCFGLAAAAVVAAQRAPLSVGLDASYPPDHEGLSHYEAFLDRFGGGYPILVAYECAGAPCTSALDPVALAMAHRVSRRLEPSPFVTRITSPANASLLTASPDFGIEARRFVVDGKARDDPSLRALAVADPLWSRALVSPDARVGALAVDLTSTESEALLSVMAEIEEALAPEEARGFRFHVVGEAAFWVAAHEDAVASMLRVGVGTGGMLFLTLLFLLRSLPAVIATLGTVAATSALSLAALPLLGWPRSELTNGAATVVLVISCADCVHFVARYLDTRARFAERAGALIATSRWILAPCLLTTATTAGAFASMASGGVLSLTRFGTVAAAGVLVAFLLTFSLLPAALVLLPAGSPRPAGAWQGLLSRLADLGDRRGPLVLGATLALALFGSAGIPRLQVELRLSELWDSGHPVKRALDFVSKNLRGPGQIELEIELPAGREILDPELLGTFVRSQAAIRKLPGVREVRSLSNLLGHANRLLRPDDADLGALESEAAIGELMTLTAAGDPGVLDPWLTFDQTRLRVSVEVAELPMAAYARLITEIERTLDATLGPGWSFTATGPIVLTSRYGADLRRSQSTIVLASSAIVFTLIGIYLRSVALAFLAVLPNAVALLLLFGVMGHARVPLDFGAMIVAPVAIGIATDDTIHFLTGYSRERRSGLDRLAALRAALTSVGQAVITTSLALSLGFLTMLTSPFTSISNLGMLSALAILSATLADLLVLPALILATSGDRRILGTSSRTPAAQERIHPTGSDVF